MIGYLPSLSLHLFPPLYHSFNLSSPFSSFPLRFLSYLEFCFPYPKGPVSYVLLNGTGGSSIVHLKRAIWERGESKSKILRI